MAERDDDTNSNRGLASMDRETREHIARKGGEESHKNDDRGSSSSSGGRNESSGSDRGGSSGGSSGGSRSSSSGASRGGREGEGTRYDPEAGQCRDDSGQFTGCPDDEQGSGRDPNKERVASRGGEHSHGGHGGSSSGSERGESSGSSSGGSRRSSSGGRSGRD